MTEINEAEDRAKYWREIALGIVTLVAFIWLYGYLHPHDPNDQNARPDDRQESYFTD